MISRLGFPEKIPVRYSEFKLQSRCFLFQANTHITDPLVTHSNSTDSRSIVDGSQAYSYNLENEVRGMANVHSLPDEPFMSSYHDNVQAIRFSWYL